jgi:tRNA (mo5U34)-methyltransferase
MVDEIKDNQSLHTQINRNSDQQRQSLSNNFWWHSIDLGSAGVTPGVHQLDALQTYFQGFGLPDNLRGKRVLEIGCWDGFYAFEAERRGAEVVAIDCWRPETFFIAKEALDSKVEFCEMSIYEVSRERLGVFDIVLFLERVINFQLSSSTSRLINRNAKAT